MLLDLDLQLSADGFQKLRNKGFAKRKVIIAIDKGVSMKRENIKAVIDQGIIETIERSIVDQFNDVNNTLVEAEILLFDETVTAIEYKDERQAKIEL